jgi:hypothetical protein
MNELRRIAGVSYRFMFPALALLALASAGVVIATPSLAAAPAQEQQQAALSSAADEHFSGIIVSLNGTRFILRDDVNDTWYHLDDQSSAANFRGKKVSVTGTLDGRSAMIHIRSIHEDSKK